jgi:hypothetical protein
MGEGSCAEMRVDGVGRLLHQARRVAGRARAQGMAACGPGPGPPGVAACRREPQGMAACPPGACPPGPEGYGVTGMDGSRGETATCSQISRRRVLTILSGSARRDCGIAVATLPAVSPIQPGASLVG